MIKARHPQHRQLTGSPRGSPRAVELTVARATDEEVSTSEAAPLLDDGHKDSQLQPKPSRKAAPDVDWLATGLCFLFPAIGGALFGYDIGATSGVLVSLTSETMSGTDWYALTAFQSGLVVSVSLFGAMASSLIALAAGNRIGRRTELIAAALLYGCSGAVMGSAQSLNMLLLGHAGYGLGMGLAMHAAPAYIAETAPPSVRGLLISLKEAAIVGGILLGYLLGFQYIDTVGGWRSMYGAAVPMAFALGVGMATLPESPRWLLLSGRGREEATRALVRSAGARSSNTAQVEEEIDGICVSCKEAEAEGAGNPFAIVTEPRYYRPLLVGMSLMLYQQITGQPSVLYYAAKIFQDAGFSSAQEATGVAVALGTFKLLMTLVAVLTVDKLGRRPLLLGGVGAMVVALGALSIAQAGSGTAAAWASAAALMIYVGAYQCSFGPISWLLVGEVFPLAVRGQAIALATFVNFGSNFLVSLALPSLQSGLGPSSTYALFGVIGVGAWTSIYLTVPETKGKSLEQIEALWTKPHT